MYSVEAASAVVALASLNRDGSRTPPDNQKARMESLQAQLRIAGDGLMMYVDVTRSLESLSRDDSIQVQEGGLSITAKGIRVLRAAAAEVAESFGDNVVKDIVGML